MISKELLSEVIGEKRIVLDYEVSNSGNEIHYGHKDIEEDGFINIYELAHKCKEWAFNNGFGLTSGLLNHSKTKIAVLENIDLLMPKISFTDNAEIEAIFKACQWILESKKEGN